MVERFEMVEIGLHDESAYMAKSASGDYVRYSDYAALGRRYFETRFAANKAIAALEAQLAAKGGAVVAMERAADTFEEIRLLLVHRLNEPERSAFWAAVEGRDAIRSAFELPGLIEPTAATALDPSPASKADGWRPMETAPKDGTRILIQFVHANAQYSKDPIGDGWIAVHEAHWIDHNGGGWTWHGLCGVATSWMPLPAAPVQTAPADPDGWIPWGGGECPVDEGLEIEVKLRDHTKMAGKARHFLWRHASGRPLYQRNDIIAYRVVQTGGE